MIDDDELREMGRGQGWPVTEKTRLYFLPAGVKNIRLPEGVDLFKDGWANLDEPWPTDELTYETVSLSRVGESAIGYHARTDTLFYAPVLDTA